MHQKMERAVLLIWSIFLFIVLSVPSVGADSKETKRTVKVGCSVSTGYYQKQENGELTGYGYDYDMALAQYANWDIEYVEDSWSNLQKMLETGEIDLLGYLIRTPEREEIYDFADMYSGTSMSCMITRQENTRFTYGSYDLFNGITVAIQEGNTNIESFEKYCKAYDIQTEIKKYGTFQEIFEAVDNGDVDAGLVTNYHQSLQGYHIVKRFRSTDFYYAVPEGKSELLSELNRAIEDIEIYLSGFESELYEKYYDEKNGRIAIFTREEEKYLESNPVVKVELLNRGRPFAYFDSETEEYRGIIPGVLEEISNLTGIQFQYDEYQGEWEELEKKEGNIITTMEDDFRWAKEKKVRLTQPYIVSSTTLLGRNLSAPIKKVAVVRQDYLNFKI